jgi:serine/threonine protein kinase
VKLSDFGLSKLVKQDELCKTSCGSPFYCAPEIFLGNPYCGKAIDIWSLGIVLYAMVCDDLPFVDVDFTKLMDKVLACKFTFPDHVSQGLFEIRFIQKHSF